MEFLMMRVGIREEERTTISRFQSGLNLEIKDKVELFLYRDLNELVQLFSRVEHQLKRKSFRKDSTPSYSKSFKKEGQSSLPYPKEEKEKEKEKSFKAASKESKSSDIKCFKFLGRGHIASQCPTKKLCSLDEDTSSTSSSEDEAIDSEEEILPCEGDLLLVRRLLNNQPSNIDQSQRENLFQTKCKVLENTYLTTSPHPKPYQLHWLNEDGDLVVDQQVKVKLSIANYEEEVLCDVVLMKACHILLGRPWQFDKKTMHNGLTNEINFNHKEKKFVLHPLSPQQVVTQEKEISKQTLLIQQPSFILLCKGTLTCTATSSGHETFPKGVKFLLKEFDDLFPPEGPMGLPHLRGIEHQIDLVPGASLPNRPPYRTNP
uniref:Uncharacterized protein n=1 Tax=Cajanus cajan TaxID=3821 RepID=A0A151QZY3_CAJCA|nr:hypothetical protein KK1_043005 [Cajanus cajan]